MTTAKVQDYPSLRKVNGAVINVDDSGYAQAKAQAKAAGRVRALETGMVSMSTRLDEIYGLLNQFAQSKRVA